VGTAKVLVSILEEYNKSKVDVTEKIVAWKKLGIEIRQQNYSTNLSSYKFEHTIHGQPKYELHKPEMLQAQLDHEKTVDERWTLLSQLSNAKTEVLQDHLARGERFWKMEKAVLVLVFVCL